ncbi:cytochrome P450 [Streptomyces sp. NPDC047072]|uniref:cytochrome P450 n=1 Tax=Streptomyces sp. NPDC047072 TaxID=3154809 RepID=UPI00340F2582
MTAHSTAPYDPLDPAHNADPSARLAAAREQCPVSQPRPGVHFVARHEDAVQVLGDPETYSSTGNFALSDGSGKPALVLEVITNIDPPAHTELRTRLRRWFAPARLRAQEPRVRKIVAGILDEWAPGQEVEIYSRLARRLPTLVVYAFLGLPEDDWERLKEWADAVNNAIPNVDPAMPESVALTEYLVQQVVARAAAPATGDDVLDGLTHPADGEAAFTPIEAALHLFQLIVAGTDTTASLITNLLCSLLEERERWERLLADPTLRPTAIEESLRLDAPLQYVLRTVKQAGEISGCPVNPGERVIVGLQSANWDQEVWGTDAESFSLDRPVGQAVSATFGHGIHACLGSPLARLETQVVLEELLRRFPNMRLAPSYRREPAPDLVMARRPDRLDVVL